MRLAEVAERSFARHETFHPRYIWFRKAYAHVPDDGGIFSRSDAPPVARDPIREGVVRTWCGPSASGGWPPS